MSRRLLFVAKYPMHYVMFRPIHRHLEQHGFKEAGDVHVQVLCRFYGDTNPSALTAEIGLEPRHLVSKWWAKRARFDAVLGADYFGWNAHGSPKVQIFHGCSFKNAAVHPKALEWDHLFAIGPYMRDQFVTAGVLKEGDPRMRMVGMPKVDRLATGPTAAGRAQFLAEHGLDPERPLLLYAPTCWEHESSLGSFGPDLVKAIAERGTWNLLLKLHDHNLDRRHNRRDWGAWRDAACQRQGVAAFTGRDITAALLATDLLVSDASSVAYEFAIRDRPIVFLETHIEREYSDLQTFGRSIGRVATGVEESLAAIEESLADPAALSERRQELVRAIFHEPGRATQNAVAALREILR